MLKKFGDGELENCMRNLEVLHRVKDEKNALRTTKIRNFNRIGHIRRRNCLLKQVIEGKIEGSI